MSDLYIILAPLAALILGLYMGWDTGITESKDEIAKLKKRITGLETLCRFDDIPELLIEHPTLIIGQNPTEKDIDWAKKAIEKYEKENQ